MLLSVINPVAAGRVGSGSVSRAQGQEPGPSEPGGQGGPRVGRGRGESARKSGNAAEMQWEARVASTGHSGPFASTQEGSHVTFEGGKPSPKHAWVDILQAQGRPTIWMG